jgi:hypothetical protein
MLIEQAEMLRKAIENLMNAKLYDALSHPEGLSRLAGHRSSWVASKDVRDAERCLEEVIADLVPTESAHGRLPIQTRANQA